MNLNDLSKATIALNSECSVECRNKLLKVALSVIQPSTQDRSKVIEKISNDFNLSKQKITELLGLYLVIIRLFIESTDKEFNAKLIDLGFPSDFVEELPLVSNRAKVTDTIITNSKRVESKKLISLKWRIDISLSNSLLVKKIPTSVILCLQLKDGRKYTININMRTFHKLRLNVALILKEITNIKTNHQLNK